MNSFNSVISVYLRELKAYFLSPIAYVIILAFVFFCMLLTFVMGNILELGDASLRFSFIPWVLTCISIFAPAVAMRLWSDEQRDGTIELLLTLPVKPWHTILGKFLAACTVWLLALALTSSIVITISYLGDPDPGPIWGGYIGAFLHASTCVAITMAVSAFTRSQVVCFIISVVICLFLSMLGVLPLLGQLRGVFGEQGINILSSISPIRYAWEMGKGVIRVTDIIYFVSICAVGLTITNVAIRAHRS